MYKKNRNESVIYTLDIEYIYNLNLFRIIVINIERRDGVDMTFKKNIHPEDKKWRTGKSGLDKNLKLNNILEIAYSMNNPKPNIIIKAGKMLSGI